MLPKHFAVELMGHHIAQDILTVAMVGKVDLSPRKENLIGSTSTECMLTEEEHKSGSVVVHRSTLFFYDRHAFNYIGQMDLLLPREMW
jgi:hypothetical protein